MTLQTNINIIEASSASRVEVNNTTTTEIAPANPNRIKLTISVDCIKENVCIYVKLNNNTDLQGEILVKAIGGNDNVIVNPVKFDKDALPRGPIFAIMDTTSPDFTVTTADVLINDYSSE